MTYKSLGVCHQPSASVCLRLATFLKFEGERPFGRSASPFSRDNVRFGVRFPIIETATVRFVVRFPYKTIEIVRCSCRLSPISSASIRFRPRNPRIFISLQDQASVMFLAFFYFQDRSCFQDRASVSGLALLNHEINQNSSVHRFLIFERARPLLDLAFFRLQERQYLPRPYYQSCKQHRFPWSDARRQRFIIFGLHFCRQPGEISTILSPISPSTQAKSIRFTYRVAITLAMFFLLSTVFLLRRLYSVLHTILPSTRQNLNVLLSISPSTRRNLSISPTLSPSTRQLF